MSRPSRHRSCLTHAVCPACERYIATVAVCPYCGLDNPHAAPLRYLRIAALTLAGVGLLFLYLMARGGGMPRVSIAEIMPHMAYATIRVSGHVASIPYVSTHAGRIDHISFLLDDGTGTLRVAAGPTTAAHLASGGPIPQSGEPVDAIGRLTVHSNGKRLLRAQSIASPAERLPQSIEE